MSDSIIIALIWCGTILSLAGGIGVIVWWARTDGDAPLRAKNKIKEQRIYVAERERLARLEAPRDVT